jgi:hypothetical protein
MGKEAANGSAEIVELGGGDVDIVGGAVVINIGGADEGEREIVPPGNDKDDATIGTEVSHGVVAGVETGDDDVGAAHEADVAAGFPRTTGVDETAGADEELIARETIFGGDFEMVAGAGPMAGGDIVGDGGAKQGGVEEVFEEEAGGVDAAIVEDGGGVEPGLGEVGLELAELGWGEITAGGDVERAGELIVEPEPGAVEEAVGESAERSTIEGQDEGQGLDEVGGEFEEGGAFAEGFANEAELKVFQITEAAVDQLGIAPAGAGGEVGFVDEGGAAGLSGGAGAEHEVAEDAGAIDAAADDEDIEEPGAEGGEALGAMVRRECARHGASPGVVERAVA